MNNELKDVFRHWYPQFRAEEKAAALTPDLVLLSKFGTILHTQAHESGLRKNILNSPGRKKHPESAALR